jgi:hypothetical protein
MCDMVKIGDKLLDIGGKKLGTVNKLTPSGVYVDFGYYQRFFDCDDLRGRSLRNVVEFSKGTVVGKSHPDDSKLEKEVKFLSEQGWNCKTYREEVIPCLP